MWEIVSFLQQEHTGLRLLLDSMGIIAFVLAVVAYFDIKRQLRASQLLTERTSTVLSNQQEEIHRTAELFKTSGEQLKELKLISNSLSTRYEGVFPEHLDVVAQVMTGSRRSIRVMADFADYGNYSAHAEFTHYAEILKHKAEFEKVNVEMIVYAAAKAKEKTRQQFSAADFDKEKPTTRLAQLVQRQHTDLPGTVDDFYRLLAIDQREIERELRRARVNLLFYRQDLPLFCWIADDMEAVFAFPFYSEFDGPSGDNGSGPQRESEMCFYTRDSRLIETLNRVFEQVRSKAEPPTPRHVKKASA